MFTILIPTFNRPTLLYKALSSVALQSEINLIDQVIVSENGLNAGSKKICDEFKNLNIKYVYQENQFPVQLHLQWLFNQVNQGYACMLCDDDWWNENHLLLARNAIIRFPDNVAYFSNYVSVKDRLTLKISNNYWNKVMHLGYDDFRNDSIVEYSLKNILALCLLSTPFHFSSMICRFDVLAKASEILLDTHPTVADRMLWAKIATLGKITFNPLPTTIILKHIAQDTHVYEGLWDYELQKGSYSILNIANQYGVDIKEYFNSVYDKAELEDKAIILEEIEKNFAEIDSLKWFSGYSLILVNRRNATYKTEIKLVNRVLTKTKKLIKGLIK